MGIRREQKNYQNVQKLGISSRTDTTYLNIAQSEPQTLLMSYLRRVIIQNRHGI
jgi:hypothetical protein